MMSRLTIANLYKNSVYMVAIASVALGACSYTNISDGIADEEDLEDGGEDRVEDGTEESAGAAVPDQTTPTPAPTPTDSEGDVLTLEFAEATNPSRALFTFLGTGTQEDGWKAKWFKIQEGGSGVGWGCGSWSHVSSIAAEGLLADTDYTVYVEYENGEESDPFYFSTPPLVAESIAPTIDEFKHSPFLVSGNRPTITLRATDGSGLDRIEFFANGEYFHTFDVATFVRQQPADEAGHYYAPIPEALDGTNVVFTAVVYDLFGNTSTSDVVIDLP